MFAASDATDGPVKQGGLAAQQAEVVARGVARVAGASIAVEPFAPELHGVLLTGAGPIVLGAVSPGSDAPLRETAGVALGKIAAPRLAAYLADRALVAAPA